MKKVFLLWLASSLVVTGLCFLLYIVVQQDIRMGANDPQIQIAEDVAALYPNLSGGTDKADEIRAVANVSFAPVNFAKSTAPFFIMYDEAGRPFFGTGNMDGVMPMPPHGVFEYATVNGEDRLTWEPRTGVRIAAVLVHYSVGDVSGFVLAGRSLKEVEKRESQLVDLVGVGWAILMVFMALCFFGYRIKMKRGAL